MKKFILGIICSLLLGNGWAQQAAPIIHDPVLIKENGTYYLFATGQGITVMSSKDLKTWKPEAPVFNQPPQWAVKAVPTFTGHIWAPDISYHNGKFMLYYSISAFGKNTSCIGLATTPTLDPNAADFKWTDHGLIIQSFPGKTNWNAIDPNFIKNVNGDSYLSFGSFWDGLKLIKLKADGTAVDDDLTAIPTIASRKPDPTAPNPPAVDDNPKDAGGNAIEAPFIYRHGGYYYLFASIDYCCKGPRSTYKMIVGRAKDVQGPYLDDEGRDMARGGGKLVLEGNTDWHGVGHNAVFRDGKEEYLAFHGYDAHDQGKPKLRIEKMTWDKAGWPVLTK
ncbi:family 43 glycosylhydrolase [Sphingobacterium thalpophilum]|uniref:Arabinan endo-1,5-alpha-L-arabinosidase n=1 Tax=Sphingobacterium thalpophilum TaxID=259 RepID=A0A4U9UPY7_9SPHI|nr:family 43 glycosylhydrolase [Sphingobacterium thalpophilum]VTR34259.1 Arabinan endo-1,5-alpha-L-arabinosidase precursor [Sphingobacterium thalpophilum]